MSNPSTPTPHQQYALSRNEEAKVLAQCKIDALRHCEVETACTYHRSISSTDEAHPPFIHRTAFSECAQGRTVSVAWKCRQQFRVMQAMTEEKQDQAKLRYLENRRGGVALP
ncbi:BZ3500_MvSof-1268-A1-R1_Chr7-1g09247 [Microbotryum saponariae]|uniref:COX assembly mitochondrial protein n=1 Tax=Microbotryum saponariae TaxID=289078 RepID=A0A2X0MW48_9BASI|nr:BZ3501_MvSof-1269-A2-R1_Chr7-1g08952 [Microbotryum saponariae]SDA03080.1 BZ3500_MvSof-1268-A1-R1_Chr7-1g09247 [Microbotryum saponariae]